MPRLILLAFIFVFTQCSDHASKPVTLQETQTDRSPVTNTPMDHVLAAYSDLTEAFVNWDSVGVKGYAAALGKTLDSADSGNSSQEVKNMFAQAKKNTRNINHFKNITLQRKAFDSLSKTIYQLAKSSAEKSAGVYLHVCPMAFNDIDSGYWLSKSSKIRNPYLGLHHPRYHGGMLGCGETLDSINSSK